jgi:hypothetical protein
LEDGHGRGGYPVGASPIGGIPDLFQGWDIGEWRAFAGISSADYQLESQVVDLSA